MIRSTFEVDDILIMHSPYTGQDTLVSYRGRSRDGKAVVYDKGTGWQGVIPSEWLMPTAQDREPADIGYDYGYDVDGRS